MRWRSVDFLVRVDRDIAPRHHSMRAVFDSSWRMLAPDEQQVAARLAVLRGHFSRAAAQAVAAQRCHSWPRSLTNRCCISPHTLVFNPSSVPATKYTSCSANISLSNFARWVNRRRVSSAMRYFTDLAEQVDPYLYTHKSPNWRPQMQLELNNFYAALTWTLEEGGDATLGLRLAGLLGRLWEANSTWKEGRQWLQRALAQSSDTGALRARALVKLGELHHLLEEPPLADQRLREGLAIWQQLQDTPNVAYTLFQLGKASATRGDHTQAKTLLQKSLGLYRQIDDRWGVASLLNQLAATASHLGDYSGAEAYLEEAWPLMQDMHQRPTIGVASNLLGRALLGQGEYNRAIALFERALQIFDEEDAPSGTAWSLINLALTYLQMEQWAQARAYFCDCFAMYCKLESKGGMMAALEGLAAIAAHEGQIEQAIQMQAVAARWQRESGQQLTELELAIQARTRQFTQAKHDQTAWQQIWEGAQHWSLRQVTHLVVKNAV
ncbi:MAG: tetratricopeptide repeat protein [Caldilineaceae bacterium]